MNKFEIDNKTKMHRLSSPCGAEDFYFFLSNPHAHIRQFYERDTYIFRMISSANSFVNSGKYA